MTPDEMTPAEMSSAQLPPVDPLAPMAPMPPAYPVASDLKPYATRVQVLGILFAVFCVFCVVSLIAFAVVGSTAVAHVPTTPPPAGSRAATESPAQLAVGITALSAIIKAQTILDMICSLIAAIGLLAKQAWGRIATIIVSVPLLLAFPFGTVLAAYAIYLMVKSGSKDLYARLTSRALAPTY